MMRKPRLGWREAATDMFWELFPTLGKHDHSHRITIRREADEAGKKVGWVCVCGRDQVMLPDTNRNFDFITQTAVWHQRNEDAKKT